MEIQETESKFKGLLEKVYLKDVIQHPLSAKIYGARGIMGFAESIDKFGGMVYHPKALRPDADGRYMVLDGWRRILAAIMLGWDYIYVEVMYDLLPNDEKLFIVECNNHREKTPREKYEEIKVYEEELPKLQGKRNDLWGDPKYDQRKEIAEKMDIAESEVRDLKTVGDYKNGSGRELLDRIDGKRVTLTAMVRKVKEMATVPDYSGYVAVETVDLEPLPCPTCNCHPTKRIEVIDGQLFYIN